MPVSYVLVDGIVLVVLTGAVSDKELNAGQRELFSDPDFVGDMPRLVDATEVKQMLLTAAAIRQVARASYKRGLRRAALVSNKQAVVIGLMRMYAEYCGDAAVEVFKERPEAIAWLRNAQSPTSTMWQSTPPSG